MHASPAWLLARPDARFVDQFGDVSAEANLVFDQRSRTAAEGYLAEVAAAVGLDGIDAVRITSGGAPEVLYPGGGRFWAFDRNAQNGDGLPETMPPNPLPGWAPGQAGPDEAQVRSWADWYVGALADVVGWQVTTLSGLGFHGTYQVLTPGVGVTPVEYGAAVRAGLPAGLLGSGAAWAQLYDALPRRPDVVAYVSSVADGSGGDAGCTATDASVPLDSAEVGSWSATRWVSRVAAEHGFAVAGENPGWHQSGPLDARYVDTSDTGMAATAVGLARSCGLRTFYWAHDDQLWDGTLPFDTYARSSARSTSRGGAGSCRRGTARPPGCGSRGPERPSHRRRARSPWPQPGQVGGVGRGR